jgi:hypothetical protein
VTAGADARGRAAQRAYAASGAAAAPAVPAGVWIVAGTPIGEPYPCPCGDARHHKRDPDRFCPCIGRRDLAVLPDGCCAVRVERYGWPQ